MKRMIREQQDIMAMARIGWVPEGSKNTIEIYVHTDDGGQIPHFHVRKYGANNTFEWEVCIRYDSPEYFSHGRYSGNLPSKKIAKQIDEMLRKPNPKHRNETYWETCINAWNDNNSSMNVDIDTPQPDYTKLS